MKIKAVCRILSLLIAVALLHIPAHADADANINAGENGELTTGRTESFWNGDDGVRITVVRTSDAGTVAYLDWTNYNESDVQISLMKRNKLDYLRGYDLAFNLDQYYFHNPETRLPTIVTVNGNNNINAIKQYFTDSGVLQDIAAQTGLPYDDLISGDYKLLIEPMVYFYYQGRKYAMSSTECALFDIRTEHDLYRKMRTLTHWNLPLSMFLERSDDMLPLYAWTGAASGWQENLDIINYLGIGVISFTPPEPEVDCDGMDYVFRCDTDVIVSFPIHNSGSAITPDDDAYVTLNVGGTNYHRQFICPGGSTQLIWVRWHTPDTPQEVTLTATGAGENVILTARVDALEENTPPDPTFYDVNSGFTLVDAPDYGSNLSSTWGEWFAEWIQEHGSHYGGTDAVYGWVTETDPETGESTEVWEVVDYEDWYYTCSGYCEEHGHWEWEYVTYSASLNTNIELAPDDRCETDYESNTYGTVMGSGYGVQVTAETSVSRNGADAYDVTGVQNVLATFPEFKYNTYNRLLEETQNGTWQFKTNPYSFYDSRIHFTPLWYPDDTYYPVSVCVFDVWTPGGQLYACLSDRVYIYKSCLDDWYIHIVE